MMENQMLTNSMFLYKKVKQIKQKSYEQRTKKSYYTGIFGRMKWSTFILTALLATTTLGVLILH